ncbi:MAG: SH3 domain-containing protein, partial [Chloroflexi bacterium]
MNTKNAAVRLNIVLLAVIGILLVTQLSILADLRQQAAQQNQSAESQASLSNQSNQASVVNATCTAAVNVRLLNQRSGPGESYTVTGGATRGEVFAVEEVADSWIRVTTSTSAGSAWMFSRYLTLSGECPTVPTSSTVMDSRPDRRPDRVGHPASVKQPAGRLRRAARTGHAPSQLPRRLAGLSHQLGRPRAGLHRQLQRVVGVEPLVAAAGHHP